MTLLNNNIFSEEKLCGVIYKEIKREKREEGSLSGYSRPVI